MEKNILVYKTTEKSNISAIFHYEHQKEMKLPLFSSKVYAGSPSEVSDHVEKRTDLNSLVIKNPASTFFVTVSGDSMINSNINHNDLLIIDASIKDVLNKIVVASIDSDITLKRLKKINDKIYLCPENDNYAPIEVKPHSNFEILGVALASLHYL
ncbi:MAG: translesion error-prone DNA polymerase V autoproteolytic subunit [Cyanobacteriota bacterium]